MKIKKNGKFVNVNNGNGALQDRMINNGWKIVLTESCSETAQQLYDRLENTGLYKDIKIYWTGTRIRGIHSYFAMVKW